MLRSKIIKRTNLFTNSLANTTSIQPPFNLNSNIISSRYLHTFPILDQILTGPRVKHTNFHDLSNSSKFSVASNKFTIHQIRAQSVHLAKIIETEIKPGDRVAAFADNSVFTVITTCAVWLAGGVFVPLSSKYPDSDIEYFLEDCDAKMFIHSQLHSDRIRNFRNTIFSKNDIFKKLAIHELDVTKLLPLNPPSKYLNQILKSDRNLPFDHPALVVYTSGTTGKPKGALHTHSSVYSVVLLKWHI